MRQINLFNPALLPQKPQFSAFTMLQALLVVVLALLILLALNQWQLNSLQAQKDNNERQLKNMQAQLKKMNTELVPKQKSQSLAVDLARLDKQWQGLQQMQSWVQSMSTTDSLGYAAYMEGLARQKLDGVWLTGFDFGGQEQALALHGKAMRAQLISQYVQRLGQEKSFHGRAFATLEIRRPEMLVEKKVVAEEKEDGKPKERPGPELKTADFVEFSLGSLIPPARGGAQ